MAVLGPHKPLPLAPKKAPPKAPTPPAAPKPPEPVDPLTAGAAAIIKQYLDAWGISDLYADALALIKQGLDNDAILVQLENTESFKRRFAANEDRKKKGLKVLSPAEYIANETQYKSVLRMYGMPAGFYDSNDDVRGFLANDVSPAELSSRAQAAQKIWLSGNEDYKNVWRSYYGLSDGDAIAALLDPKMALPIVEQKLAVTQIGAAAARQGLTVDRSRAELFAASGVDEQAALAGYGQIAASASTDATIAERFGQSFGQADEENDRLLSLASAQRKRRELYGQEAGLFGEQSGTGQAAFTRPAAGSY